MATSPLLHGPRNCWTLLALTALVAPLAHCTSTPRALPYTVVEFAPDIIEPLSPDAAALLALERSPRVRAAFERSHAATLRAKATALPPDPSLALSWGFPIGMGDNPVTAGIMGELAWLFARDRLLEAADSARNIAAEELLAVTSSTAAEARKLTRSLASAREAVVAAAVLVEARRIVTDADAASVLAGELAAVEGVETLSQRESALAMEADMRTEAHEFEVALSSLLHVRSIGPVQNERSDVTALTLSTRTLEVLEAEQNCAMRRSDLAELDSWFASGLDGEVGYERDMEGDKAVMVGANIGLPIFRRGLEVQAALAELRAAEAQLAEALRMATLDAEHATDRVKRAREAAHAANVAAEGLERVALTAFAALDAGESSRKSAHLAQAMAAERRIDAARRAIVEASAIETLEARTRTAVPPANARAEKEGGAS